MMGCAHTNELANYQMAGKNIMFSSRVDPGAMRVDVSLTNPKAGEKNVVADILTGATSEILSAEAQKKIDAAVKPQGIAAAISDGLEKSAVTYLRSVPVSTIADDPMFITETVLRSCTINSSSGGISLGVRAETSMFDRSSGKIVWQYASSESVPLRRSSAAYLTPREVQTASSIYNATEFFRLSEKEIQDTIMDVARGVGRKLGDMLREDYSESR